MRSFEPPPRVDFVHYSPSLPRFSSQRAQEEVGYPGFFLVVSLSRGHEQPPFDVGFHMVDNRHSLIFPQPLSLPGGSDLPRFWIFSSGYN